MAVRTTEPPVFDMDRLPRPVVVALFALCCMVACSIGMAARRPFILAAEVRAENEDLARQLMDLKYKSQSLEKRVAELQTPRGKEREARARGYLKPNETRLTFLP